MSDSLLRKKLIRLAHAKPELRGEILPLLKTGASINLPGDGSYDYVGDDVAQALHIIQGYALKWRRSQKDPKIKNIWKQLEGTLGRSLSLLKEGRERVEWLSREVDYD